ncbi:hypothetical protein MUN82_08040 [Hymenobacter aerilatus]|uniref:Uncharacterized protein n=1 Tax=Hymenobacter aerilatus TaxID=2932251 RepID=A0A8T9SY88_9BACT|nr:hypothetical protein [Hymenobacter aerilatus]UOR07038.1 hypothetical protein MUN82_08040 [Hymenobacter aerilatus]
MKKAYLTAALLIGLYMSSTAEAIAQDPSENPAIQQRAVILTRTMATKMRLDEGQYLKLKQLNVRWLTEMETLKQEGTATVSSLDEQASAMQAQYESEMLALLYPAQQQIYRHSENTRMAFRAE